MMNLERVPVESRNPFLVPVRHVPRPETKDPARLKEKARRAEIREMAQTATQLNEELTQLLLEVPASERPHALAKIRSIETLSLGEELDQENGITSGRNAVSRRYYDGDPIMVAYVKPRTGESSFTYEPTTREAYKITRVIRDGLLKKEMQAVTNRADKTGIQSMIQERGRMRQAAAAYYAIPPEEIPLHDTEVTPRAGIEIQGATQREFIASQINELARFDVIPITILRSEQEEIPGRESEIVDICSVQEAVENSRIFTPEDWKDVLSLTVSEDAENSPEARRKRTLKQSLMRLACFDYLIRMQDRHVGNVLYNPDTGEVKGIDNGYCLGLSSGDVRKLPNGYTEALAIDPYVSAPLEAIEAHPDWKLDAEALEGLRRMYEDTREYLEYRDNKTAWEHEHPDTFPPEGKIIKHITKLFRLLYQSRKIAEMEGRNFFVRLSYLIQNKRPPDMGPLLIPQTQGYENDTSSAA